GSSGNSSCGRLAHDRIVGNRQIHRIGERDGSSALAIIAVATRAVLAVENVEVCDFVGHHRLIARRRAPGSTRAAAEKRAKSRGCEKRRAVLHCGSSWSGRSFIMPGAAKPARTKNGTSCCVRTCS